jgi:hypothetical protein
MNDAPDHSHASTKHLLDLLRKSDSKITLFVTGEFYERYPELVEQAAGDGHEIGYHTHNHPLVTDSDVLQTELGKSEYFLKRFQPRGFRAPWIYLKRECLGTLRDFGFVYDSSCLGEAGDYCDYDGIWSMPVTTIPLLKRKLGIQYGKRVKPKMLFQQVPIGSGYMVSFMRTFYQPILNYYGKRNRSVIFYLHPWQILKNSGIRHSGLRSIHKIPLASRLESLIENNPFTTMTNSLNSRREGSGFAGHCLTFDIEC